MNICSRKQTPLPLLKTPPLLHRTLQHLMFPSLKVSSPRSGPILLQETSRIHVTQHLLLCPLPQHLRPQLLLRYWAFFPSAPMPLGPTVSLQTLVPASPLSSLHPVSSAASVTPPTPAINDPLCTLSGYQPDPHHHTHAPYTIHITGTPTLYSSLRTKEFSLI